MKFTETALAGSFVVDIEPVTDERGFFARTWCREEFDRHGLTARWAQCSLSFNRLKGTLRGMHYQAPPHAEEKLVRCTMGAVYDVIVDLREQSPTFRRWVAIEISADNRRMVYVPAGIAHGFQTLVDDTEVAYQISTLYVPAAVRGVRWDDPAFDIRWPEPPRVISDRDRGYELYEG